MRDIIIFMGLCLLLFFPLAAEEIDELGRGVRKSRLERREARRLARQRRREEKFLKKTGAKLLSDKSDELALAEKSEEEMLFFRNAAYDEIFRKCKETAEKGEVTYFSLEDLQTIIDELKSRR